ncbi:MAG: hypothetical protein HY860_06960 [Chlamydiales bacterium]|nr:hypothetical protein [Chlamydiales bacterium]
MRKLIISLISCFLSIVTLSECKNVGLCIMATGKYATYAETFIESARKHFCTDHKVTYFVFTDQQLQPAKDVVRIEQKRLGWPHDTMMRFSVYYNNKDAFNDLDYIFASDADMLFVADVGSEILSDRVATQHPGFVGKRGSYETNPISMACINDNEGSYYFAGGFYGANKEEFVKLCGTLSNNIEADLTKNFIAVWHDESHLNRYFINNPPTKILNPSYCYPESWNLPYEKKLLALDKNHAEMRK